MKLSIAIPTYEFHGFGVEFLRVSLDRLKSQSFTDFEVIISDQSQDSLIKDLCDTYSQVLDIKYIPNIFFVFPIIYLLKFSKEFKIFSLLF